jgi:hypothetical protein
MYQIFILLVLLSCDHPMMIPETPEQGRGKKSRFLPSSKKPKVKIKKKYFTDKPMYANSENNHDS